MKAKISNEGLLPPCSEELFGATTSEAEIYLTAAKQNITCTETAPYVGITTMRAEVNAV